MDIVADQERCTVRFWAPETDHVEHYYRPKTNFKVSVSVTLKREAGSIPLSSRYDPNVVLVDSQHLKLTLALQRQSTEVSVGGAVEDTGLS